MLWRLRLRSATAAALLALAVPLLIAQPAWASHPPRQHAAKEVWGCTMCPSVRQDGPGTCPSCGMDLVRIEEAPPAAAAWGCTMCPGVRAEKPGSCPVCGMDLVPLGPPDPSAAAAPARPLMPGVPNGLFYAGCLGILVASFAVAEIAGRRSPSPRRTRLDLFRLPALKTLVRKPWFRAGVELPFVLAFLLVLAAGLAGNQDPRRNIAPVLTWTIWWTWLAFVILFLGKLWCTVCPWMALARWTAKIPGLSRLDGARGRGRPWPRRLRNIWLATGLFVGLTWLELGYGVTEKPWLTAALGIFMTLLALATLLTFERKAFCRYACLVGRVSGLYALFAASELRASDRALCRACSGKDCYHGNDRGEPCPTHQFLGFMNGNTYCTMCLECVKSCPKDNVSWNLRPPGADLLELRRTRTDEAYLAVVMLSMSAFHGLTMTPSWDRIVGGIQAAGVQSWLAAFSVGMTGILVAPLLVYYAVCALMRAFSGNRRVTTRELFEKFAYSLLPIALFYHLAHNVQHILFEGMKLVRLASDPFGWGWDLFGTAAIAIDAAIPVRAGWAIQIALVLVGHVFGILVAHRIAAGLYGRSREALLSQIPILAAMLAFSFQSLWLLSQPMMMRTAM